MYEESLARQQAESLARPRIHDDDVLAAEMDVAALGVGQGKSSNAGKAAGLSEFFRRLLNQAGVELGLVNPGLVAWSRRFQCLYSTSVNSGLRTKINNEVYALLGCAWRCSCKYEEPKESYPPGIHSPHTLKWCYDDEAVTISGDVDGLVGTEFLRASVIDPRSADVEPSFRGMQDDRATKRYASLVDFRKGSAQHDV